jgi:hypothetical protein
VSVAPILTRALRDGGIFALVVAVVAGAIGWFVSGGPGLVAGLVGAAAAAVFMGLTAVSILVAARVARGDLGSPVFYAIVLGTWVLKLLLFAVLVIPLRTATWLDPVVFFWAIIVAVLGSLVIDAVSFMRTRVPYVSDARLPDGPGSQS